MDPLSITASTFAIIQLTADLITGTTNYCKSVQSSRKEIADLIQELKSFDLVLKSLKDLTHRAQKSDSRQLDEQAYAVMSQPNMSCLSTLEKMIEADAPLSRCYHEMLAFKTKLLKHQSALKRSFKWPFEREEVKAAIKRLRNLNALLLIAIASDSL